MTTPDEQRQPGPQPAEQPAPADQQTPTRAPAPPRQPGAPVKGQRPDSAGAWAAFVAGMRTMPAEQARGLAPEDISMHVGPVMDEEQFEAYRRARGGRVQVVRR